MRVQYIIVSMIIMSVILVVLLSMLGLIDLGSIFNMLETAIE